MEIASWFLIMVIEWGGYPQFRAFPYADKTQCEESLERMQVANPASGDGEWVVVAFCSPTAKIPPPRTGKE